MKWIGLTGGIGSGKSTVGKIIENRGFPVIDADQLAREVVRPGEKAYQEIISFFGPEIVHSETQEIDRAKLAEIVFKSSEKLQKLEDMTHPEISARAHKTRQTLAHEGHKTAFYMIPLLFENNLKNYFDEVIVVSCSEVEQKKRVARRDHFSEEEINERLDAQMPLSEKELLADHVISNTGTLEELEKQVIRLLDSF